MKLGLLLGFLTGCGTKPPEGPGTSAVLRYPVLLIDDRRMEVRKDALSLTSATVATGLVYEEYSLIDADGARYAVGKVTEFGKKSVVWDMGTSQFRVFIELKAKGKMSLGEMKELAKATAGRDDLVTDKAAAGRAIDGAGTVAELIRLCGESWRWR